MSDEFTLDLEQQGSLKRASIRVTKKVTPRRVIVAEPTVQQVQADSEDTCVIHKTLTDLSSYLMGTVTFSGFNKGDKVSIFWTYQDKDHLIIDPLHMNEPPTAVCSSKIEGGRTFIIGEETELTISAFNIVDFRIDRVADSEGNKCTFTLVDKTMEYSL